MYKIPEKDRAKEFSMPNKSMKALGVKWDVDMDNFHFSIHLDSSLPVTKRNILRNVASIYDPLGLISPVVLEGRIILQETTVLV